MTCLLLPHEQPLPGGSQLPEETGAQGTKESLHETTALLLSEKKKPEYVFF